MSRAPSVTTDSRAGISVMGGSCQSRRTARRRAGYLGGLVRLSTAGSIGGAARPGTRRAFGTRAGSVRWSHRVLPFGLDFDCEH
jgi:hypothetical protein